MRKETPIRNNPGITKILKLDEQTKQWKDSGKFRAVRRVFESGSFKREQSVFDSLEEARSFRRGSVEDISERRLDSLGVSEKSLSGIKFSELVEEWKNFHYLQLEKSSQQMYETRLPNLNYLNRVGIETIDTSVIDGLVKYWVNELPRGRQRETFGKELDLLKLILNFYRKRKNPAFLVPILEEHYKASDIAKKAEQPVQSLSREELGRFLEALKESYPGYYGLALAQFSFGLRIGEACALKWSALDLKTRIATIEDNVVWDNKTWEPSIKRRKNKKTLVLVIPDLLIEELKQLKTQKAPEVDLLFHNNGHPLNRHKIGKAFNRVLKRLDIKHVHGTHMVRKTSATLATEATGDFYAVSKLLDHSSPDITLRYVSQTSAQKRKVASALNGILEGAIGKPTEPTKPGGFVLSNGGSDPQKPTNESTKKFRLIKSTC